MAHHHSRVSDSASAFAFHIRALHEIGEKIIKNNADYKAFADLHSRLRTFNVGDYVMVCTRPKQFSQKKSEEITRAKRRAFPNPQENQFICLCDGSPTGLWHQLHF